MRRARLGKTKYSQPISIDCTRVYSPSLYRRLFHEIAEQGGRIGIYPFIKRALDLFLAILLLIVLAPLMLTVALLVKITSPGEVIFRQTRIGKDQKPFTVYKFRTMVKDTPHDCPSEALLGRERYLTPIGRVLRRFSLDELPQLFCVLSGTMSLVGYRPLIEEERDCHKMRNALSVYANRPGLTGYAQLVGRDEVTPVNKALLDGYYAKHMSFFFDLSIVFGTVLAVLTGRGNEDKRKKKT